jgi:hypothetical protein
MSKRFLPPPKQDEDFAVQSANNFLGLHHDFLNQLGQYMEIGSPTTAPRRPTPFSALWQFSADLEGKTGEALQKSARRRLRGILALLALRSREGIALSCKVSPPFNQAANQIPVVDMLRRHLVRRSADIVKDSRIIYLTVGGQVVAGYSPSTLLFPAAKRLKFLPNICPNWYNQDLGEWLDPTDGSCQIDGSEVRVNGDSIAQNAGAIRVWLDSIISWMANPTPEFRGILQDSNLLRSELVKWRQELNQFQPVGEISHSPLSVQGDATPTVTAFLSAISALNCTLKAENGLLSSLTLHKGRYLLSKSHHLTNPNVRLYGNIFGSPAYDFRWENAPVSGNHLGEALGLPPSERDSLPLPFIFVDKLFTSTLSCISDKEFENTPDTKWRALKLDGSAYAFPLSVASLEFFSPDEIEQSTNIEGNTLQNEISVSFSFGNFLYIKKYAISSLVTSIVTLDPALDFRLFPDYDLCELSNPDRQVPYEQDRCYYARIRMSKGLVKIENQITPIFEDNGKATLASDNDFKRNGTGALDSGSTNTLFAGRKLIIKIQPGSKRLCGFQLGNNGLLILQLEKPKQSEQPSFVGIDFGTSNTCLSTRAGDGSACVLKPGSCTTTFLKGFTSAERDGTHEGHSADFDFFPKGDAVTNKLYAGSYFPTQLASRNVFDVNYFEKADLSDPFSAQICFESLSDFIRKGADKVNTVSNYAAEGGNFTATVFLKDRLKWDKASATDTKLFQILRKIFLQHLRLQLVHAVAKGGGYVSNIRASFPRAFTKRQSKQYKLSIEEIWRKSTFTLNLPIEIFTESYAAAAFLRPEQRVDHFLIDVGGGTTDICIFSDGSMKMESSVKMAADIIDSYFLSSAAESLRATFFEACSNNNSITGDLKPAMIEDLKRRFLAASVTDREFDGAMVQRGVLYTMLGLTNAANPDVLSVIYDSLNESAAFTKPGIRDFFTTLAIFYGGVSYFSGLMIKQKVESGEMMGRRVEISFAGNGSNHLAWLRLDNEKPVEEFLAKMFRAGSGLSENVAVTVDILSEAKASVALGLMNNNIENTAPDQVETRVYDRVDGACLDKNSGKSLSALYSESDPAKGWNYENSEVKNLLSSLVAAAPKGMIGSRQIASKQATDWAEAIVLNDSAKNSLAQTVGSRLASCKRTFATEIEEEVDGLALEPVLVAELTGILSILRNRNATQV